MGEFEKGENRNSRSKVSWKKRTKSGKYFKILKWIIIRHTIPTKAFLVAQMVKNLPTIAGDPGSIPGQEDLLEKEMATHSSILAWRIPRTEEPGGLQSMASQRIGGNWATSLVAQLVKNPPAMWATWVWSLDQRDPLEKGMATLSSILAWKFHGLLQLPACKSIVDGQKHNISKNEAHRDKYIFKILKYQI